MFILMGMTGAIWRLATLEGDISQIEAPSEISVTRAT
jgi:hypothetical protein